MKPKSTFLKMRKGFEHQTFPRWATEPWLYFAKCASLHIFLRFWPLWFIIRCTVVGRFEKKTEKPVFRKKWSDLQPKLVPGADSMKTQRNVKTDKDLVAPKHTHTLTHTHYTVFKLTSSIFLVCTLSNINISTLTVSLSLSLSLAMTCNKTT